LINAELVRVSWTVVSLLMALPYQAKFPSKVLEVMEEAPVEGRWMYRPPPILLLEPTRY
jgi:hypothetical protein